jgi:hypothetical protein
MSIKVILLFYRWTCYKRINAVYSTPRMTNPIAAVKRQVTQQAAMHTPNQDLITMHACIIALFFACGCNGDEMQIVCL